MSRRKCRRYRARIAGAVDRPGVADLGLRRHLRSCESCSAELAQHRSIGKALRSIPRSRVSRPLTDQRTRLKARFTGVVPASPRNRVGIAGLLAVAILGALGANSVRQRT